MKTKYFLIGLLIVTLSLSCSEQLDINTNPLSATSADPNTVLPYVIVQYSNRKITEVGTRMVDVWQNTAHASNSPKADGGIARGPLSGNMWAMYYTLALSNLKQLELEAQQKNGFDNVRAISIVLQGQIFYELTSLWENVPFSESLNAIEFPNPKFDSQEDVLFGIVDMMDNAISIIDKAPTSGLFNVSTGDLIYGGNLTKWKAYANSIKIRVLMIIRNVDPSVNTLLVDALSKPYISKNSDCPMIRYAGTTGALNGYKNLVVAFGNGSNIGTDEWGPSSTLVSLLQNDPRRDLWLVDGSSGGFQTQQIGFYPDETTTRMGDNLIRGNLPDVLFQPAEITFYRAELAALGVINEDENALYLEGIKQAIEFWGKDIPGKILSLTDQQIIDFLNQTTKLTGLPVQDQLELIYKQTYLTHFWWPIESWNTVRRTGVPTLEPVPGSVMSTMLRRLPWANAELAANPNTPKEPALDLPMWFEN
ncbi:MAG: SusD/RagB family nutrient-binding outer membrane lipoprotein [Chryseotalea sp.]|jgi:hypothetical protein